MSWEGHGLRLELDVALKGRALVMRMTLENVAPGPIPLAFSTSKTWDAEVRDEEGRVLWRWSAGKLFLQVVRYLELSPGEAITFRAEWEAPKPGRYTVVGYFVGHVGDLSGPTPPPLALEVEIG